MSRKVINVNNNNGEEIVFLGTYDNPSITICNVLSNEYKHLSDVQNYKSIGAYKPYYHCIFKNNYPKNENEVEYISFEKNYIGLYKHGMHQQHVYKLELDYEQNNIEKDSDEKKSDGGDRYSIEAPVFPISHATCLSLSNISCK